MDRKEEIRQLIRELQKELKEIRESNPDHLNFEKLNELDRLGIAFQQVKSEFRKLAISIHFFKTNRTNIHEENIIELEKGRNAKVKDLTKEQIAESNELLQKMLEPYVEAIKDRIAKLKGDK